MYYPNDINREIGTAWFGRHVVIITCNPVTNQFLQLHKSLHAPTEPPNPNCAEAISQFLSIGYKIAAIAPLSHNEVQYVLVK
ncbi:hypothetical protein V7112_11290 [Bacillus sp. JJ1566]|uniref:hypothetical protein n=1 Tax=Bacillus sp. JJ1566 TaxID=3122961 RepID=UPI002FFE59FD